MASCTPVRRLHCSARLTSTGWRGLQVAALLVVTLLIGTGCAGLGPDSVQSSAAVVVETQVEQIELLDVPVPRAELFGARPELPTFEDMLVLTEEQQQHFLNYFNSPENIQTAPHRRLSNYLQARLGPVHYQDETLTARDVLVRGEGNCMSLTLATTALARLGSVRANWRLNLSRPIYSSENTVIYSSNHIQTRLYDREIIQNQGEVTVKARVLVLDFFNDGRSLPGTSIEEQQLAGLVFQNLAAEELAQGDLDRAYWLAQDGLAHDPRNAELYNILAVLHQRAGDGERAEAFYRFAVDSLGGGLVILRNLYDLLLADGRTREAQLIERRIASLPDRDPYPLLQLGDEAQAGDDPRRALRLYQEARRKAPYLHEIYGRIAEVQRVLSNASAERAALEQALSTAQRERDREEYRQRLARAESLAANR